MVKEPISRLSPTENKKPACSSFGTGGLLKSTLWIHRRQCDLRDLFFLSRSLPARAHHVRCKSRSPVSSFESPPPLWASPHATCVRSARIAHVRFRGHYKRPTTTRNAQPTPLWNAGHTLFLSAALASSGVSPPVVNIAFPATPFVFNAAIFNGVERSRGRVSHSSAPVRSTEGEREQPRLANESRVSETQTSVGRRNAMKSRTRKQASTHPSPRNSPFASRRRPSISRADTRETGDPSSVRIDLPRSVRRKTK